eukprot:9754222-Heterocapsa_arctica.AAC.1
MKGPVALNERWIRGAKSAQEAMSELLSYQLTLPVHLEELIGKGQAHAKAHCFNNHEATIPFPPVPRVHGQGHL